MEYRKPLLCCGFKDKWMEIIGICFLMWNKWFGQLQFNAQLSKLWEYNGDQKKDLCIRELVAQYFEGVFLRHMCCSKVVQFPQVSWEPSPRISSDD